MGDNTIRYQGIGGQEKGSGEGEFGTSIASPQVAATIAYLFQHPTNGLTWTAGQVAQQARDLVSCLYDPNNQNGCFGVLWNSQSRTINNGVRSANADGSGGDEETPLVSASLMSLVTSLANVNGKKEALCRSLLAVLSLPALAKTLRAVSALELTRQSALHRRCSNVGAKRGVLRRWCDGT